MIKQKRTVIAAVVIATFAVVILSGCTTGKRGGEAASAPTELADYTGIPEIPVAVASGVRVAENSKAVIDYSNAHEGYIMVKFIEQIKMQAKVLITIPDETQYIYRLVPGGDFEVLPLTGGDGEYLIEVFEEVEDQLYAHALTKKIEVFLDNEFAPFLRPNQYVKYSRDSDTVRKAAELTAGIDDTMKKIEAIYDFVIENIRYDPELAATVQSGYIPDLDADLESGMGICFDYAALMTAMLRSQSIPTKMVLGYTGDTYHAWISVFSEEAGWVDEIIFFDGENWKLMDPTFASWDHSSEMMEYIGNPDNYNALYQY